MLSIRHRLLRAGLFVAIAVGAVASIPLAPTPAPAHELAANVATDALGPPRPSHRTDVASTPIPTSAPTPTATPATARPDVAAKLRVAAHVAGAAGEMALINQARAANGLAPLAWSGCLAGVAMSNASRVAALGTLSHANGPSQDRACALGSSVTGENLALVSNAPDDQYAFSMQMGSPVHRANILRDSYRYIGCAWAVNPNGASYLAVEFG